MRADLRRTHRRLWPVLGILLAVGVALGLALKPERPLAPGPVVEESKP